MSHNSQPVRIAIAGTEAVGKTTFITTFVKAIQINTEKLDWQLAPVTSGTQSYIEEQFAILKSGEWPAGTQSGTHQELIWELKLPSDSSGRSIRGLLQVVDPPGHDFRALYTSDYHLKDSGDIPRQLQEIAQYYQSAEVILLLINLKDFISEQDIQRRTNNELALMFALDFATRSGNLQTFCVVLTKCDLYPDVPKTVETLRRVLPIFAAKYLTSDSPIFPAMAVDKTEVVTTNGRPRRVPAKGFGTRGYPKLMVWLHDSISTIHHARLRSIERVEKMQREDRMILERKAFWKKIGTGVCIALGILLFSNCIRNVFYEPFQLTVKGKVKHQSYTFSSGAYHLIDLSVRNNSSETLTKRVIVTLNPQGESTPAPQIVTIKGGETLQIPFSIESPVIKSDYTVQIVNP